jgi:hypothetical protein
MSSSCLISSKVGDTLLYFGGKLYEHKVIDKQYLSSHKEYPSGCYPVVDTGSGKRRVVHPYFYTVRKIIRHI